MHYVLLHLFYEVDGDGFVVQEDWQRFLEDLYPGQSEVTALARNNTHRVTEKANDLAIGKTNYSFYWLTCNLKFTTYRDVLITNPRTKIYVLTI